MQAKALVPATGPTHDETAMVLHLELRAHYAKQALAPNTRRGLATDRRLWEAWCKQHGLCPLPAESVAVCQFLEAQAGGEKVMVRGRMVGGSRCVGTLRRLRSSISTMHKWAGQDNPCDTPEVGLLMKALARELAREPRQAQGLTWERVKRLIGVCDASKLIDVRDRALLLVGYDTLCRRSELAALMVEHLEGAADGSGVARVVRAKNDQAGQGSTRYLAPPTWAALQEWLQAAGICTGPVFRAVRKGGKVAGQLTGADVGGIIKKLATRAEARARRVGEKLDLSGVSGHSLRVGCVQDLASAGVELPEIMRCGGWKSPAMVARYGQAQAAARGGVAKLAVLQGRN